MDENKVLVEEKEEQNSKQNEKSQKSKKKIIRNIIIILLLIILLTLGIIFFYSPIGLLASRNDVKVTYSIADNGDVNFELKIKDGQCIDPQCPDYILYDNQGNAVSTCLGYYKVKKHFKIPFDDEGNEFLLGFGKDEDYIKLHPEETFKYDDRNDKLVLIYKDGCVVYYFSDIAKELGKTK